jgi:hypothetical protein
MNVKTLFGLAMAILRNRNRQRGRIRRGGRCRGCFYATTHNAHPCRICKRIAKDMPFDHFVARGSLR